jgi:hypothetical protein
MGPGCIHATMHLWMLRCLKTACRLFYIFIYGLYNTLTLSVVQTSYIAPNNMMMNEF